VNDQDDNSVGRRRRKPASSSTEAWQGSISNVSREGFEAFYDAQVSSLTSKELRKLKIAPDSYRGQYVLDAKRGVAVARHAYRALMRLYWSLRALVIAAGISVAAVAATPAPRWSLALLGALAAGAETVIAASNLQERAVVSGLLADQMGRELRDFHFGSGCYATGDALEILHDRIEKIRSEASTARFRLDRATASYQVPSAATGRAGSTETASPE